MKTTINGITFESTGSAIADKIMAKRLAKEASKPKREISAIKWAKLTSFDPCEDPVISSDDLREISRKRQAGSSLRW